MDNGSKIVSDAILGEDLKFITIGGKVYNMKPPSIKVILATIRHLSKVSLKNESYSKISIMAEYPKNTDYIVRGIAVLVLGEDGRKAKRLAKKFKNGTFDELLVAFQEAIKLMGCESFFAIAQSAKNLNQMAAKPK